MERTDNILRAFITNLGKYNEGELVGEWVDFPCSEYYFGEMLKKIGIGSTDDFGQPYEEWFVTDYDTDIDAIHLLGEYPTYESLQAVGELLYQYGDLAKAAYEYEPQMWTAKELDDMYLLTDVHNDSDLGYYLIDEGLFECPEYLKNYIDYERLGRDCGFDGFFSSYGYLNLGY